MNISISESLAIAKGLRESGKKREALAVYREIISHDNSDLEALMWSGVTYIELGEVATAIGFLHRAHLISPYDATICSYYSQALGLIGKQDQSAEFLIETIESFQKKFLDPLPEVAALHTQLAEILHGKGSMDEAIKHCKQAIKIDANHASAYQILGNIQTQFQIWSSAIEQYKKCIALQPENAIVRNNLGIVLRQVGDLEQSTLSLEAALLCDPGNIKYLTGLGTTLLISENLIKANEVFNKAVKLHPNNFEANFYLGKTLDRQKKYSSALSSYANAAKIKRNDPQPFLEMSKTLRKMGRYQDALKSTEQIPWEEASLPLKQMAAELQLGEGLWAQGWASLKDFSSNSSTWNKQLNIKIPLWQGQPLANSSLLLHNSMDYSEEIFFSRFIPKLAEQGAKVIVHTDPRMKNWFKSIPGVHEIVIDANKIPNCAWHTPFQRLPALLKADQSELISLYQTKKEVEQEGDKGLKIGIAWESIPAFFDCESESLPLECFARLSEKGSLFALQWGLKQQLKQQSISINDLASSCKDFYQIAQAIQELDLVVSCDSAIAHLAAVMGVPVWLIASPQTSWYWANEKSTQVFYPSVRVFKQSQEGNLDEVLDKIESELQSPHPKSATH